MFQNDNGGTTTGLYTYFLPAHQNAEDYMINMGLLYSHQKR
jgi:hypothetical protein